MQLNLQLTSQKMRNTFVMSQVLHNILVTDLLLISDDANLYVKNIADAFSSLTIY